MESELQPNIKLGIEKEQSDVKQQGTTNDKLLEPLLTDARIVGVDIPFMDLVWLLVKLAIAAIPAAIIVGVLGSLIGGFLIGLLNSV